MIASPLIIQTKVFLNSLFSWYEAFKLRVYKLLCRVELVYAQGLSSAQGKPEGAQRRFEIDGLDWITLSENIVE